MKQIFFLILPIFLVSQFACGSSVNYNLEEALAFVPDSINEFKFFDLQKVGEEYGIENKNRNSPKTFEQIKNPYYLPFLSRYSLTQNVNLNHEQCTMVGEYNWTARIEYVDVISFPSNDYYQKTIDGVSANKNLEFTQYKGFDFYSVPNDSSKVDTTSMFFLYPNSTLAISPNHCIFFHSYNKANILKLIDAYFVNSTTVSNSVTKNFIRQFYECDAIYFKQPVYSMNERHLFPPDLMHTNDEKKRNDALKKAYPTIEWSALQKLNAVQAVAIGFFHDTKNNMVMGTMFKNSASASSDLSTRRKMIEEGESPYFKNDRQKNGDVFLLTSAKAEDANIVFHFTLNQQVNEREILSFSFPFLLNPPH